MCFTLNSSSNAAPTTTPPFDMIAFARWVNIPPDVLSCLISLSLLLAAKAVKSFSPLRNCFIGQALRQAEHSTHFDSSISGYKNPSLSGFIEILFVGHLSAHAEHPQQSYLSNNSICFDFFGGIPSSAFKM